MGIIQNETQQTRNPPTINRTSMNCEITSSCLIYVQLKSPEKKESRKVVDELIAKINF